MLGVFANLADIGFAEQVNWYKQTQYLRAALLGAVLWLSKHRTMSDR